MSEQTNTPVADNVQYVEAKSAEEALTLIGAPEGATATYARPGRYRSKVWAVNVTTAN